MLLDPAASLPQDLVGGSTGQQVSVRDAQLRGEIRALDVDMGRILVLKEHQELEAAKPRDLRHPRSGDHPLYRAIFALVQALLVRRVTCLFAYRDDAGGQGGSGENVRADVGTVLRRPSLEQIGSA